VRYVTSLPFRKEVTKKTSFGKPKVQVCSFAKRERRASHGRKHCPPRRSPWEPPGFAALQRGQRRKTYIPFVHRSPHSQHERQALKAKIFMEIGRGEQEQKVFEKAICVTLR
jgi:hypothetical protein